MFSHPRRHLARLAVATAAGVVLAGVGASPALADATDGRNAVHFNLTCGGEQFGVVSPSEPAAAVQLIGSTSILVGTDALLTTTYTDPQTGQPVATTQHVVYGAGHGDANGVQGRLLHCTNTIVVDDPDLGPITITLVAQFILAPPN
jgi:hypothetical protein